MTHRFFKEEHQFFFIMDLERGTVYVSIYFDHDLGSDLQGHIKADVVFQIGAPTYSKIGISGVWGCWLFIFQDEFKNLKVVW